MKTTLHYLSTCIAGCECYQTGYSLSLDVMAVNNLRHTPDQDRLLAVMHATLRIGHYLRVLNTKKNLFLNQNIC